MAVGVFLWFCMLFSRAVLWSYFCFLIVLYLSWLKSKISERSRRGPGSALLLEKGDLWGGVNPEELPGGRVWPYPDVLQPVGMLGLRGAPDPTGDAGTERKT